MANQQKVYGVEVTDTLRTLEAGVNAGISPDLLAKNQMANALNVTVRGDFATVRPYFQKIYLDYGGDATLQAKVEKGVFQEAKYYQPDNGLQSLLSSLSGNLLQFVVSGTSATVKDVTGGNPQSATAAKCWMWQAEKWMIWNDGINKPVFFDGATTAISNHSVTSNQHALVAADIIITAVGTRITGCTFNTPTPAGAIGTITIGTVLTFLNFGQMVVVDITAGPAFTLLNQSVTLTGQIIHATGGVSWNAVTAFSLPPGRMGAYGMGRNWMSLVDAKQFIASDLVGGSSGTLAFNYRDAVLNVTENTYLAGGGNFAIPGSYGEIQAMIFTSTLDVSLGQGPLQVFTADKIFSCQAPTDRLTWQDLTNPILTVSLNAGGGLSQDATVCANSDVITRSFDGLRSLILSRREDSTWGNTPISLEVDPILTGDDQSVIRFSSAVVFDNRFLITAGAVTGPQGVYFRGIVPLNFDPVSTLRGKQPAVYDSVTWTGLNVLKLVTGTFSGVKRCFAFTYNSATKVIELWEILQTVRTELGAIPKVTTDSGNKRVIWRIESATMFKQQDPRSRPFLRLTNGEIYVDNLIGTVDFQVWYKPDQWPSWVPWIKWSECAATNTDNSQPQFRPRMGLGTPSIVPCDPITNRPLCEAFDYQLAVEITGHCTFKGGKLFAVTMPEPPPAPICSPICQP